MRKAGDPYIKEEHRTFEADVATIMQALKRSVIRSSDDVQKYRHFNFQAEFFLIQSIVFILQIFLTVYVYLYDRKDWIRWFNNTGEVRRRISTVELVLTDILCVIEWMIVCLLPIFWFLLYKLWCGRTRNQGPIDFRLEKIVAHMENAYVILMMISYCGYYLMDTIFNRCLVDNFIEPCEDESTQRLQFLAVMLPLLTTTLFRNTTSLTKSVVIGSLFVALVIRSVYHPSNAVDLIFMIFPTAALIIYDMDRLRIESYLLTQSLGNMHKREKEFLIRTHQDEMKNIVANIAHDLRTPLTSISLGTEFVFAMLESPDQTIQAPVSRCEDNDDAGATDGATTIKAIKQRVQVLQSREIVKNMTNSVSVINMAVNQCIDFAKSQSGRTVLVPSLQRTSVLGIIEFAVNVAKDMRSLSSSASSSTSPAPHVPGTHTTPHAIPKGDNNSSQSNSAVFIGKDVCEHILSDPTWLREGLYSFLLLVTENVDPVKVSISESESDSHTATDTATVNYVSIPNVEVYVELVTYENLKTARNRCCQILQPVFENQTNISILPYHNSFAFRRVSDSIGNSTISGDSEKTSKQHELSEDVDSISVRDRSGSSDAAATNRVPSYVNRSYNTQARSLTPNRPHISLSDQQGGERKEEHGGAAEPDNESAFIQFEVRRRGKVEQWREIAKIVSSAKTISTHFKGGTTMGIYSLSERMASLNGFVGVQCINETESGHCDGSAFFAVPYIPHIDNNRRVSKPPTDVAVSSVLLKDQHSSSSTSSSGRTATSKHKDETISPTANFQGKTSIKESATEEPPLNEISLLRTRSSSPSNTVSTDAAAAAAVGDDLLVLPVTEAHEQQPPTVSVARTERIAIEAATNIQQRQPGGQVATEDPGMYASVNVIRASDSSASQAPALNALVPLNSPILPQKKMNVLVVEDTMSVRKMVTMLLKRDGHNVDTAENGQIGVDKWIKSTEEAPYDLILMDIQMPVMDGLEAMTRIRELEKSKSSTVASNITDQAIGEGRYQHIIAMSANDASEYRDRAARAGSDAYMTKPFNMHTLYGLICNLSVSES